jgi:hypothetical protein
MDAEVVAISRLLAVGALQVGPAHTKTPWLSEHWNTHARTQGMVKQPLVKQSLVLTS